MLSLLYGSALISVHDHWKTIALARWTFVSKVMSLLFNSLSRLVIALLPRSKRLLISWLQSLSAVSLEAKKIKSLPVSTVSPSICREVMGRDYGLQPTRLLRPWDFLERVLEWGAITFSGVKD